MYHDLNLVILQAADACETSTNQVSASVLNTSQLLHRQRLTSSMSTSSGVCSALKRLPSNTKATDSKATDAFAQYACMSFLQSYNARFHTLQTTYGTVSATMEVNTGSGIR